MICDKCKKDFDGRLIKSHVVGYYTFVFCPDCNDLYVDSMRKFMRDFISKGAEND